MYNLAQGRTNYSRGNQYAPNATDVYATLGLEMDDGSNQISQSKIHQKQRCISFKSLPSKNFLWRVFALMVIFSYMSISIFQASFSNLTTMTETVSMKVLTKGVEEEDELEFEEEEPTFFRDVVLDLPVQDEDVPIFWSHESSDSSGIKEAYSNCYDIKLMSENGISDLSSYGRRKVYFSTELDTLEDLVTPESYGRMLAFFRHPFHSFLEQGPVEDDALDNPLTRKIIGGFTGEITYPELAKAKRLLRQRFVVGLLDENLDESFHRIADYFGWAETGGPQCTEKYLNTVQPDKFGDMMHDNSEQWTQFLLSHKYDLQIYEFVRSMFRAQKQTIISLEKQILFDEMKN